VVTLYNVTLFATLHNISISVNTLAVVVVRITVLLSSMAYNSTLDLP